MKRSLAALLFLLAVQSEALAWYSPREVVHGTARPMEQGEMLVGILSPLGLGIHERVVVFTNPIVMLLMTPNVQVRLNLYDKQEMAIALEGGYQQSFLSIQQGDQDYPGFMQGGVVFSRLVRKDIQFTVGLGYDSPFGAAGASKENLIYYRTGIDFLSDSSNLLMLRLQGSVSISRGQMGDQVLTAVYVHQFGRTHLSVGFAAGSFPITTARASDGSVSEKVEFPLFPWLDLWWRF